MKNICKEILITLGVIRLRRIFRRYMFATSYYQSSKKIIHRWIWKDTEESNFYYSISELNRRHLADLISNITGETPEKIEFYFKEIESNTRLSSYIEEEFSRSDYPKSIKVEFGRRIGWYAIARITKPKYIVETGVDHGIGSILLCSALIKNSEEGYVGQYIGTDINKDAGQLLKKPFSEFGKILYGDSIETIKKLTQSVDLFINDSDHSAEYEYGEYQAIHRNLSKGAIILGDNSHVTDKLSKFSRENGRNFIFFSEKPENHWYPGAGIGFSFNCSKNDV